MHKYKTIHHNLVVLHFIYVPVGSRFLWLQELVMRGGVKGGESCFFLLFRIFVIIIAIIIIIIITTLLF